jgi:Nucleotidyltransferase domain
MDIVDWGLDLEEPKQTWKFGATLQEVALELVMAGKHIYATGSRVTSNYTKDSDYDIVVLDDEDWSTHNKYSEEDRWYTGESGNQYSEFMSLKKTMVNTDTINLIFVRTKDTFQNYVMATDLIRKVNPKTKKERIELFDLIFNAKVPF